MNPEFEKPQSNQVVIITGGAGGMGLATAKVLGQTHCCVLSDVDEERLKIAKAELESEGISCHTTISDITNQASVKALMVFAKKIGPVVSLIHTAGVSPHMGDAEFIIRVNALGTIWINEEFFKIATTGASLINVASMAAHSMPNFLVSPKRYAHAFSNPNKLVHKLHQFTKLFPKRARSGVAYGISKHFVVWYSKTQAKKFGQKGLRVLSVSPGTFETPMGKLEKKSYTIAKHSALGRVGKTEEIAHLLAFCASNKASYLTGTDILCDGGTISTVTPKQMRSL